METITVSVSICLCILVILILGVCLQPASRKDTKKAFIILVSSIAFYLAINLITEASEVKIHKDGLSYAMNMLLFFCADFVSLAFLYYLFVSTKGYTHKWKKPLELITFLTCGLRIALVGALTASGQIFYIEHGVYHEGQLAFLPYLITVIVLIEFLILIIVCRKAFSRRQMVVMIIYQLLPIPAVLIESFCNIYYLTGIALTISVSIIYVLIQDTEFEKKKIEQNLLEELTHIDFLTGLCNRRAYYERWNSVGENENIGIVFCDLNGLKYANDNYGHAFGDELIKKFSVILEKHFGHDNSFRIAGDEFVAIVKDRSLEEFNLLFNDFKQKIEENKNIAAIGSSFGLGKKIDRLVSQAETEMYKDKEGKSVSRK